MKNTKNCILGLLIVCIIIMSSGASYIVDANSEDSAVLSDASNKKNTVTTEIIEERAYTNSDISLNLLQKMYKFPERLQYAKWTVSNKKIAKLVKTKEGFKLKIGKKTGTFFLETKLKRKTETVIYKYKFTVIKKYHTYEGKSVKAKLEKFNQETMVVYYRVYNGSKKIKNSGTGYSLFKYVNGKWKRVPEKFLNGTVENFQKVPAHTWMPKSYKLLRHYDISKLTKGIYRLYIDYEKKYVPFTIR